MLICLNQACYLCYELPRLRNHKGQACGNGEQPWSRRAHTLTNFSKRAACRRLTRLLVARICFLLYTLKKYREMRAAMNWATTYRAKNQRMKHRLLTIGCTNFQAQQRRKMAVQRVRKIRDPFCDMSFKDCQQHRRVQEKDLDEAGRSKTSAAQLNLNRKCEWSNNQNFSILW